MKIFYLIILFFCISIPPIFSEGINNPAVYYSFSGNTQDQSGNNKDATSYGATLTTDRFGNTNSAYYFDGSSYMSLPTSILENTNQLTYSLWIKTPQYNGSDWPAFIGSYTNSKSLNVSLGIWQNSGHLWNEIDTTNGNYAMEGNLAIPWNTWFHAALVYNGATITEYINGQKGRSVNASGNLKNVIGLYLGQYGRGANLTASLDEVYIYNAALSETEIGQVMNDNTNIPEHSSLILFTLIFLFARTIGRNKK